MPDFSVLIPHNPGDPHRDRVCDWNRRRWETHCPQAEVLVGGVDSSPPNRSANRNLLAAQATTDLLVFADADCTARIRDLGRAVEMARANPVLVKFRRAAWVLEEETLRVLGTDPAGVLGFDPEGLAVRKGQLMGFFYILSREVFDRIGRWDERFVGWGEEDIAFTLAAQTLAGMEIIRPRRTTSGTRATRRREPSTTSRASPSARIRRCAGAMRRRAGSRRP
jgi:hypothetical protein